MQPKKQVPSFTAISSLRCNRNNFSIIGFGDHATPNIKKFPIFICVPLVDCNGKLYNDLWWKTSGWKQVKFSFRERPDWHWLNVKTRVTAYRLATLRSRPHRATCSDDVCFQKSTRLNISPTTPILPVLFILSGQSLFKQPRAKYIKLHICLDDLKPGFSMADRFVAN